MEMFFSIPFSFYFISLVTPGKFDETEYRLIRYLMSDYDKHIRPSVRATLPINVSFGLSLTQIINVDERNQVLTTSCWLNQAWIDFKLRWDPREFGNISVIRLPEDAIWKPDIILYNNLDQNYKNAILSTYAIVSSDGNVTLLSAIILHSSCRISVRYFPFDEQNCSMKFASWTYDGYQINLIQPSEEADLSNYVPNGEWELLSLSVMRNVVFYSCCLEPYPDLTYQVRLRRRPLFYIFNFVLPCVLITAIALLGFYMPSDSGEKVTLGITTLLSMTVFMMLVAESMPPTSEELPLIGIYYGVTIIIVSLATGMTVFTLNLHHQGFRGKKVPPLLRRIAFLYLAKIIFFRFDLKNDIPYKKLKKQRTYDSPELSEANKIDYFKSFSDFITPQTPNNYCKYIYNDYSTPVKGEGKTTSSKEMASEDSTAFIEKKNLQKLAAKYHNVLPLSNIIYNNKPNGIVMGRTDITNISEYIEKEAHNVEKSKPFQFLDLSNNYKMNQETLQILNETLPRNRIKHYIRDEKNVEKREEAKKSSLDIDTNNDSCYRESCFNAPRSEVEIRFLLVLEKIHSMMDKHEMRILEQDEKDKIKEEWMQIALIMDRILLLLFVTFTIIISFMIIYSSPYSKMRLYLDAKFGDANNKTLSSNHF
ncbi:neuronal acetylcholine receptor subunit beta-4-like isoform X1 [Gordionus sp. m RMFG-2023]|uniref:neuronal acetylcholine receptor subunit beta-4-like isoform X1 n=2 Tax=Gordionus sp. m RMFG-2023 TaxID=3053472 RepID=UPI0031FD104B